MNDLAHLNSHTASDGIENILRIKDLDREDILNLLDHAQHFADGSVANAHTRLDGKIIMALFVENSTRTRLSFEMATKRLGGEFILMTAEGSSLKKGESAEDTLETLNAMRPDALVIRHADPEFADLTTTIMDVPVLNGGNGTDEHPTQALLDALTVRQHFGDIKGMNVVICGDIKHSRVARSNVHLLTKLGAQVTTVAPESLQANIEGAIQSDDLNAALKTADAVMMLRIQKERFDKTEALDIDSYIKGYQLNADRLKLARPHCAVLHPGPMNRDIEITGEVADLQGRSLITRQVENGVYMRMACLDRLVS